MEGSSFYSPASQGISLQQDSVRDWRGNGGGGGGWMASSHFP